MAQSGTNLGKAYVQIMPSADGIAGSIRSVLAPEVAAAGKAADGQLSGAFQGIGGKITGALKTAAKVGGVAIAGAGTAAVGLAKQAVSGFADYEQLAGGVEKLFGKSASIISKNAAEAYKTSGLSANQYMEQATSFSASLINSLGGDQKKAAEITDVAMRAMSDNVNVFGSNAEDVQNAIQGFSKQNYTMLDNLKLGYGGTKEEMQRLIDDANAWGAANGKASDLSIDSFADVITAIDYIQQKQGIAGTTAKEASTTISGSLGMLSTAWSNLVTGFARDDVDMGELIQNVVSSATSVFENVLPVAEKALQGVADFVTQIAPVIAEKLPGIVQTVLPALIQSAMALVKALVSALPSLVQVIVTELPSIIQQVGEGLVQTIPVLLESVGILINGLMDMAPVLLETLKNLFAGGFSGLSLDGLPGVIQTVGTFITDLVGSFLEELPQFIEFGTEALMALVSGLVDNLPAIADSILNVVTGLVDMLIKNLPAIWDAGFKMLVTIGNGLIDAIPKIQAVAWDITKKLWSWFISVDWGTLGLNVLEALGKGVVTGGALLVKLFWAVTENLRKTINEKVQAALSWGRNLVDNIKSGISNAAQRLWTAAGNMINGVKSKITDVAGDAWTWGRDLVQGFIDGIYAMWDNLTSTASNLAGAIRDYLGFSEPEKGPLSNFHTFAPDMVKLFAQGIRESEHFLTDQVASSFDLRDQIIGPETGAATTASAATGAAAQVSVTNHIAIYQQPGESSDELIERMIAALTDHYEREGAVFANGIPT